MEKRGHWGSRFGFIMAAAGSAVGLGNIWRFPYLAGENGGGAFMLIYLFFALVVGLSIMIAEFTIGRNSGQSAATSYRIISKNLTFAGVMGILTSFLIMGFYPVVGGWAVAYIFKSFTGLLSSTGSMEAFFNTFTTGSIEPLIWMFIFMAMNIVIVARGVSTGIETASKILMPALLGILIIIAIKSVSLPGSIEGLKFLFVPRFNEVTPHTFLAALGQAFFSLSLGSGCMITYGSYLKKQENIPENALMVTLMDTACAVLAGIAIFPALFAYNVAPAAGPGLVFVVLPSVFAEFGSVFGPIFSSLFFIALVVAALTSSVSLLEVTVAYFIDEKDWSRKKAVWISSAVMLVCCILASLSLGSMSGVKILGVGFFGLFDLLTDKVFMAIGGMLVCITLGWLMKKDSLIKELNNNGALPFPLFHIWYPVIKYALPPVIGVIAVTGIWTSPERSVMVLGLGIILLLALVSKKL